jgi:hypothetical protein
VEDGRRVVPRGPAVSQGLGVGVGVSKRTVVGGRELGRGASLGGAVWVPVGNEGCRSSACWKIRAVGAGVAEASAVNWLAGLAEAET